MHNPRHGLSASAKARTVGVRKQRKSRSKGLRTTTGCTICRRRHMKCDEIKPLCGPCAKGGRKCSYEVLVNDCGAGIASTSDAGEARTPTLIQPGRAQSHRPSTSSVAETTIGTPVGSSTPAPNESPQLVIYSPKSVNSVSTGYGLEVAPLRWFGLLAGDAARSLDASAVPISSESTLLTGCGANKKPPVQDLPPNRPGPVFFDPIALQDASKLLQIFAISPQQSEGLSGTIHERSYWQRKEPVRLKSYEYQFFHRFVKNISEWIDLFDPLKHFSTFVPHLALHNDGLMKAILALGARHSSIKPMQMGVPAVDRTTALQYYYETLQYLQTAMRFTTYKNSLELLATVLVVSTYEMIDDAGKGWERHLKGVFWIQRGRDINGESGGLEQAIWWAWIRQDVWAAFRERRRCFSFFVPTKTYDTMSIWDIASRIIYVLAQTVNYSSLEETQLGEHNLNARISRAHDLLAMLDEWQSNATVHFQPLPVDGLPDQAFAPIWIHPGALAVSLQLYNMARLLLLVNQPSARGYVEYIGREKAIHEAIDTIAGIALTLNNDACQVMSTQCLFAAGMYCHDARKQECIARLIRQHQTQTGWPCNNDLAEELQTEWNQDVSHQ